MQFVQVLKAGWMRFAYAMGRINTRIILTLLYIFLIGPVAMLRRLFLFFRRKNHGSFWMEKEKKSKTLDALRRPF